MKYVVILGDGMADWSLDALGGKTPLSVAKKPNIDYMAKRGEVGLMTTVPKGMKPGSDVANLAVLGYDPKECYSGRSPLEAASIGIELTDVDITARANLVTISDEPNFEDKIMVDYSAGEISTAEAREIIKYLADKLNDDIHELFAGISYRHCYVTHGGELCEDLTPPHDISGKRIGEYLPKGKNSENYLALIKKSYELLKEHPINIARKKAGKNPASCLWFWGEGTKPSLQLFKDKFGVRGAMISAVDLLKGIGKLADMEVVEVEGATGNYDTNFTGKAKATVNALLNGNDLVYLHMEAPDECGHHGDLEHKIYSIEQIDGVVKYIADSLRNAGEHFSMLICPDHPTPIAIKTHVSDPVPYILYRSNGEIDGKVNGYTEVDAKSTGIYEEHGYKIMTKLLSVK